nr:immunoglobulin heavy chain junction region [Macaca mulatta]
CTRSRGIFLGYFDFW